MIVADLASKDSTLIDPARDRLAALLSGVFPANQWLITATTEVYTEANKRSQWSNELQKAERDFLGAAGEGAFAEWLGPVHYVSVTVTYQQLFAPRPVRDNGGWRLSWLALPAPAVFAVGLAHHYQGTPAQDRLGRASNFLFDVLEAQAANLDPPIVLNTLGRKVIREDWDSGGLTAENMEVAHKVWPGRLPLRFARNTTTKKILSTFVTIRPVQISTSDDELTEIARGFHRLMQRMVD